MLSWWLFLASGLFVSLHGCRGQSSAFQWKFTDNLVSLSLEECGNYGIIVEPRTGANASALGTPPYYITAFVPDGVTTLSLVGSDPSNLLWQVNQPVGASLLLGMTDANGNSGGQPPSVYNVISGNSSSCVPPVPSVNITIASNVTGSLKTCQPLGLRMFGGQKPYTITLAAPSSPLVTNVTLGPHDDVLTYIDRADPNGQLLAAVSDANGVWGTSTLLLDTFGNTNVSCVGLISTSGNSSTVNQHPSSPSSNSNSHTDLILEIVIPVVVGLLLLTTLTYFYCRRRRIHARRLRSPMLAVTPEPWITPAEHNAPRFMTNDILGLGGATLASSPRSSKHMRAESADSPPMPILASTGMPVSAVSSQPSRQPSGSSLRLFNHSPESSSTPSSPSSTSSPSRSSASPLIRAKATSTRRPHSSHSSSVPFLSSGLPTLSHFRSLSHLSSPHPPSGVTMLPTSEWSTEPDIIIQHRDGGVVHELPPPYLDRSAIEPQVPADQDSERNNSHSIS